ncbi:MAG TPA: LTA synthase family protein, partial [Phycisphaerae bacterium]|nr:LTA synthase family protein [Phycisphaerae bacterium]
MSDNASLLQRAGASFPRLENTLLLLAFLWTIGTKWYVLGRAIQALGPAGWAAALLPDVLFFALLYLVFSLTILLRPRPWSARILLIVAAVVALWSGANAAWLTATGVQLQPAILQTLSLEPTLFWPIVRNHLAHRPALATMLLGTLAIVSAAVLWRILLPAPFRTPPAAKRRKVAWSAAVVALSLVGLTGAQHRTPSGPTAEVLGFSSHWYAMMSFATGGDRETATHSGRQLPFAGSHNPVAPTSRPADPPNIIILLLESASYEVTSLGNPTLETTPHLRQLADEGTEFVNTHIPVAHTTDAIWCVTLGVRPELAGDNIETVLMDEPYLGLPAILKSIGYRSAFFQVSKGTFQCAPGLMANLGFDYAWFRENLEDPTAHLGYLGGDDMRMLEPAMTWACREKNPFLLVMITSASHDPFHVPAWFAPPKRDRQQAYLQSIRFGDHVLGGLREELRRRGLEENTILCVIGDHGESFRSQGQGPRYIPYEEIIRVPWVIARPGHGPRKQRITWPCSQLDVAPTLMSMVGLDPAGVPFEGRNALEPAPEDRR